MKKDKATKPTDPEKTKLLEDLKKDLETQLQIRERLTEEIERIIYKIYENGLEPKEEQSESGRYCFLDYPEIAKKLGTDQYLTMVALEAVKADIIP